MWAGVPVCGCGDAPWAGLRWEAGTEEMEDERKQFEKELADRDHAADMTRTKYQRAFHF